MVKTTKYRKGGHVQGLRGKSEPGAGVCMAEAWC